MFNWGDDLYDSALAFDHAGLQRTNFGNVTVFERAISAPVPEPEAWALMLAGAGMVGMIARRRRVRTAG